MTRTMGDAIHDNVGSLVVARPQLVAGYVTGSSSIQWTAADWALFPGIPHVTIDQGFTGSPVPSANVLDVEPGAWTPAAAVAYVPKMTSPRPTVYSDQADAKTIWGLGYRGPHWLAWPGWTGTSPPTNLGDGTPVPAGVQIVAVQNQLDVANAYDLSVVFDPVWPGIGDPAVQYPGIPGIWQPGTLTIRPQPNGTLIGVGYGADWTQWSITWPAGSKAWTGPTRL